jgi:hypothetical protein
LHLGLVAYHFLLSSDNTVTRSSMHAGVRTTYLHTYIYTLFYGITCFGFLQFWILTWYHCSLRWLVHRNWACAVCSRPNLHVQRLIPTPREVCKVISLTCVCSNRVASVPSWNSLQHVDICDDSKVQKCRKYETSRIHWGAVMQCWEHRNALRRNGARRIRGTWCFQQMHYRLGGHWIESWLDACRFRQASFHIYLESV